MKPLIIYGYNPDSAAIRRKVADACAAALPTTSWLLRPVELRVRTVGQLEVINRFDFTAQPIIAVANLALSDQLDTRQWSTSCTPWMVEQPPAPGEVAHALKIAGLDDFDQLLEKQRLKDFKAALEREMKGMADILETMCAMPHYPGPQPIVDVITHLHDRLQEICKAAKDWSSSSSSPLELLPASRLQQLAAMVEQRRNAIPRPAPPAPPAPCASVPVHPQW